jgi:rSAM-associated Gly-rich repeat protein
MGQWLSVTDSRFICCMQGGRPLNISTRTGLVGFFLALSALQIPVAGTAATTPVDAPTDSPQPIESRLARLTEAIRQRESQLSQESTIPENMLIARAAWGNGGGGGFANRVGPGGFVNGGGGGGFVNGGGWRNGSFGNGGGFVNW